MSHDEARLGAAVRPKRARRVAGLGAQGEEAALLQELGDALEAAVRALRRADPLAEGLVRRIQKVWLGLSQRRIDWLPTELRVGARVVLTAGGEAGRFLVPAYQAGLRAVTLRPEGSAEQLGSFCRGLAMLEAGTLHPSAFGRLCWRGELLGLDLVVVETAVELGESLVREIAQADLWADRSRRVVDVWSQLAQRAEAVPETDREARYGQPLAELRERTREGQLELTDDDVRALMQGADDAAGWAGAEVSLLLHHPSARSTVTADQLAWVLATYVEHAPRIDDALLSVLASLGLDPRRAAQPSASFGPAIAMLGPAFARRLLADSDVPSEAWPVLDSFARELRGAVFAGLCQHGEAVQTGEPVLTALCRRYGAAELLAVLDPLQIGPVMAAASVRAALATGGEPAALLRAIERMDPESALSALAAGAPLCPNAVGLVAQLLVHEPSTVRHLPSFVRAGAEPAACGGAALLAALASGAEPAELDEIMVTLMSMGQGRAVVLPVWKRRALRSAVRRSALLALQADPRLFSDAMHFADSGAEPKDLRELLEELRWQAPT